MPEVSALTSFEHNGARRRGDVFDVSDNHAKALHKAGLVQIIGAESDPSKAAGAKSSASPAAPVSPQTTAQKSKPGARSKKSQGAPKP